MQLADVNVELMSLGPPGPTQTLGVQHHRYRPLTDRPGLLSTLGAAPSMRQALARRSTTLDVLHTHGLWTMPNIYPARYARIGGPIMVLSPRGMLNPSALAYSALKKRLFWHFAQKRAAETAALIHATSDAEYEDIHAAGLRQPVAIIPNGVDVPDDAPQERTTERSGYSRTVLFLGRLHPIKGVDLLLSVWALLENKYPDWNLRVVGPGERRYVESLHYKAKALGLRRCEIRDALYGYEKMTAFRAASLFVLPSATENFGMTVAESLSSATPVITTKGTPWGALRENRCGWWIEQGMEPLAAALEEAMRMGASELSSMGQNGRNWMKRDFAWEAIARQMVIAYRWSRFGGPQPSFLRL